MKSTKAKSKKSAPKVPTKKAVVKREETVEYWRVEITERWQGAVESIIDTGKGLIEAKAALKPKGLWTKLFEDELPFSKGTVSKLMKIASDPRLTKVSRAKLLPPSWNTLYMLTDLDDKTFKKAMDMGTIHPDMERSDVEKLLGKSKPPINRDADDAEVVDDDNQQVDDDPSEPEVESEDDDEPTPSTKIKEPSGPTQVQPRLNKTDRAVDSLMDTIQIMFTRIEQFEEELDKDDDAKRVLGKSKLGREMFDEADRLVKNLNRIVKKYHG